MAAGTGEVDVLHPMGVKRCVMSGSRRRATSVGAPALHNLRDGTPADADRDPHGDDAPPVSATARASAGIGADRRPGDVDELNSTLGVLSRSRCRRRPRSARVVHPSSSTGAASYDPRVALLPPESIAVLYAALSRWNSDLPRQPIHPAGRYAERGDRPCRPPVAPRERAGSRSARPSRGPSGQTEPASDAVRPPRVLTRPTSRARRARLVKSES